VIAWGEAPIDDPTADAIALLSAVERARLSTQRSARRRAEFVAGRLAARRALSGSGLPLPRDLAIDRDEDGAPLLIGLAGVALSITHARVRAIAAVADRPIGIDLCDATDAPRIRRVARRAFPRAHERALVLEDDRSACLAWAAKEAVAKALRIGMLEGGGVERIEIVAIDPLEVRVDAARCDLVFEVRAVDEGWLVAAAKG
jgi:4'-phosphopantetheinyl transferase